VLEEPVDHDHHGGRLALGQPRLFVKRKPVGGGETVFVVDHTGTRIPGVAERCQTRKKPGRSPRAETALPA